MLKLNGGRSENFNKVFDLILLLDSCKARIAIEVMAVVLCVILARNERDRTWAFIERNFVAETTQMITPEQIATIPVRFFRLSH